VNIKIRVCQIIGPAAAGSAGPVPTALAVIQILGGIVDICSKLSVLFCVILKQSCRNVIACNLSAA